MNEKDFDNLVESIKEAGKIKRGELPPSRRFEFTPLILKPYVRNCINLNPNSPS